MPANEARRQRQALAAALAVIVVWGASFSVQKYTMSALTPGGFLFARYLLLPTAAVCLLLWYRRAPLPALTFETVIPVGAILIPVVHTIRPTAKIVDRIQAVKSGSVRPSVRLQSKSFQKPQRGKCATTSVSPAITAASRRLAGTAGLGVRRPRPPHHATGLLHCQLMLVDEHPDHLSLRRRPYSFRLSTSLMAAFSRARSAYIRFSLAFSASSSRSRVVRAAVSWGR